MIAGWLFDNFSATKEDLYSRLDNPSTGDIDNLSTSDQANSAAVSGSAASTDPSGAAHNKASV